MELIFEIVFGFIAELVATVIGEALVELGLHSLFEKSDGKAGKRFFIGFLYATGGFVLGALSLKVLPLMVLGNKTMAIAYIVVIPILSGLALCVVNWIMNRGIDERAGLFQLTKFIYGAAFALTFSLARTIFG